MPDRHHVPIVRGTRLVRPALLLLLLLATIPFALAEGTRNLPSTEVKRLMAAKKSIFLLDVRSPREYRQGRLHGGVLIPLRELENRINEIPRDRTVVVYCAVGSRSAAAADILEKRGFTEVINMADGIMGWYRNGFPVER